MRVFPPPLLSSPQLCIFYTSDLYAPWSFEVRSEAFLSWNGGDGFQCACPRCRAYRADPGAPTTESRAGAALEAFREVAAAASGGDGEEEEGAIESLWGWEALPAQVEAAEARPPAARAQLVPLLLLSAWAAARGGDTRDAAAAAARAAEAKDALFGPYDDSAYCLGVQLDAALFAIAAGDAAAARRLAGAAARAACARPPGGDASPAMTVEDFFEAFAAERAREHGTVWAGAGCRRSEAVGEAGGGAEGAKWWVERLGEVMLRPS